MTDPLVVFYSRTGTTKAVGEAIAGALKCHIEEIVDPHSRAGFFGYLRSGNEATFRRTVEIAPSVRDPSVYDLVIVGTPVWRFSVSSPVRTYLSKHQGQFKNVAFFCTEDWRGGPRVFRQMEKLCGLQPVAVLELRADQVLHHAHMVPVKQFAERLRGAVA